MLHEGHCKGGACNPMSTEAAAEISATGEISVISDVLFISFGFLKFSLSKTGLVVLVLFLEIAWPLKSYS